MVSSAAQRTLVKSPPELWAEVSDPAALARHLGEFGEIRITRTDPEQKVEWESDDVRGTVELAPSGWGTKVSLTAIRELRATPNPALVLADELPAEPPAQAAVELRADELPAQASTEQRAAEPDPELPPAEIELPAAPGAAFEPDSGFDQPEATQSETTQPETTQPGSDPLEHAAGAALSTESRRGFFGRLFRRRRKHQPDGSRMELDLEAPAADSERQPLAEWPLDEQLLVEQFSQRLPEPLLPDEPHVAEIPLVSDQTPATSAPTAEPATVGASVDDGAASDLPAKLLAAELLAAEELAAEHATAVLTAVLDRLGAAHHRPFSRA
ncbi:MAG TPA: hypothetical protein VLJ42_11690 [Solirubrobacteraceae bacterium]|nr:hypothetical protein [Solirubrobacteraceae bacterium]